MSDASSIRSSNNRGSATGRNKTSLRFFNDTGSAEVSTGTNWAPLQEFDIIFTAAGSAEAADTAVYIANRPVRVVAAREVHAVVSTGATVILKKAAATITVANGTAITGTWDLNSTILTPVAGVVEAATSVLATGDRLVLDFSGTVVASVGLNVTVTLRYI